VEHLLTPKLLSEIDKELKNPDTDPHNEPIPKL
jgi:Mn-dependent DtxR family transcriptional regulator